MTTKASTFDRDGYVAKLKKLGSAQILNKLASANLSKDECLTVIDVLKGRKVSQDEIDRAEAVCYMNMFAMDTKPDTLKLDAVMEIIGETDPKELSNAQVSQIISLRDGTKTPKTIKKEKDAAEDAGKKLARKEDREARARGEKKPREKKIDERCKIAAGTSVEFEAARNSKDAGKKLKGEVVRTFFDEPSKQEWVVISVKVKIGDEVSVKRFLKAAKSVTLK